jgi:hypothetical protein
MEQSEIRMLSDELWMALSLNFIHVLSDRRKTTNKNNKNE